jgi:Rha family phage regulatory protein
MELNLTTGIVFQQDGQAVTTSLIVAREFDKEHRNVMRDIRELIQKGVLKNEQTPMFVEKLYVNEQNGQQYPMYLMNRDGFTLLAMGFTGERALEFKMKFLQAFNAMGQLLSSDEYILMRSQQIMKRLNDQLNQRVQMLEGRNALLEQENQELAPKAQYTDDVLQSNGTYTHSEMAKELNFRSWVAFIDACKKDGILFKHQGGMYMLYAKYSGKGYMKTRTNTFSHKDGSIGTSVISVWTEAGRHFLHEHFNVALQPIDLTMFNVEQDL